MINQGTPKEPYRPLVRYIERVVPRAYKMGLLSSETGLQARFGELLGDADRANVWSWLYEYSGLPRNRRDRLIQLNRQLDIEMEPAELDELFSEPEETDPVRKLFQEIDISARPNKYYRREVRHLIAEKAGLTVRTLYRYESDGKITPKRKGAIKAALIELGLNIPKPVIAAALD